MVNGTDNTNAQAKAWVTIEQNNDGGLQFKVKQTGGSMGSLRGVYFEVNDLELQNSFVVKAATSSNRLTTSLESQLNGTDMSSSAMSTVRQNASEVVNSYSFVLTSKARPLTLSDFSRIHLDDDTMNVNDDQSGQWIYLELA